MMTRSKRVLWSSRANCTNSNSRSRFEIAMNSHRELMTFMSLWLCCCWVLGIGNPLLPGPAASAADVQDLETVEGWGRVVDPLGDCKFHHAGGKFTINVAAAYHDLWPVKGQVHAPLVLQE